MDTPKSQILSGNSLRDEPKTPTPRRKPHCKSCGSPMLGHKRGLCQTPTKVDDGKPKDRDPAKFKPMDLSAAFMSLQLDEPDEGKPRRRSSLPLQRADTLVSLATGVEDELDALVKPGIMTDAVPEEDENHAKANIQKWLQDLPPPASPFDRRRSTPRRSNIFSSPDTFDILRDKTNSTRSPRKSIVNDAQRLGRTSTVDEREIFFNALAEKSKKPVASIFTIDMEDIQELAANAKRLEFHARIIAPRYADGTTSYGWLVIGRDKSSVEDVFKEVERDVKNNTGLVSAAFGSGTVGAIVAWICLAYS